PTARAVHPVRRWRMRPLDHRRRHQRPSSRALPQRPSSLRPSHPARSPSALASPTTRGPAGAAASAGHTSLDITPTPRVRAGTNPLLLSFAPPVSSPERYGSATCLPNPQALPAPRLSPFALGV